MQTYTAGGPPEGSREQDEHPQLPVERARHSEPRSAGAVFVQLQIEVVPPETVAQTETDIAPTALEHFQMQRTPETSNIDIDMTFCRQ